MNTTDVAKLYETLLCSPGMNETVKVDLRINRKTILLLSQVIQRGLKKHEEDVYGLPEISEKESVDELQQIVNTCLQKGELTELNEKLQKLSAA